MGHFGIIFNSNRELLRNYHAEKRFELHHYTNAGCYVSMVSCSKIDLQKFVILLLDRPLTTEAKTTKLAAAVETNYNVKTARAKSRKMVEHSKPLQLKN
jgi:hypothetical protein